MESSSFLLFLFRLIFLGTSSYETNITSSEALPEVQIEESMSTEVEVESNATLDAFATCLKENDVTFYGAFWCPHCQNQKALFGDAAEAMPYVECSTPDGQAQTDECQQENIQSYPTWQFADGSKIAGEMTLEELSEKTQCGLPDDL